MKLKTLDTAANFHPDPDFDATPIPVYVLITTTANRHERVTDFAIIILLLASFDKLLGHAYSYYTA